MLKETGIASLIVIGVVCAIALIFIGTGIIGHWLIPGPKWEYARIQPTQLPAQETKGDRL